MDPEVDPRLVGFWQVVSWQGAIERRMMSVIGGKPGDRVEFTDQRRYFIGSTARRRIEYRYRARPEASPPELDLYISSTGDTTYCVYSLDGDHLTTYVAVDGKPRPTSPAIKVGEWLKITYKRVAAPRTSKSPKKSMQSPATFGELSAYLHGNVKVWPLPKSKGQESVWLFMCDLPIKSGTIWAGDPMLANVEDGSVVEVCKGTYTVEAKCIDFGGAKYISRLRVRLDGVLAPTLGPEVGEAGTDSAAIGICDAAALKNDFELEDEVTSDLGVIRLKRAKMPYVAAGFGDGTGPVFELLDAGRRVGIELEFIASNNEAK